MTLAYVAKSILQHAQKIGFQRCFFHSTKTTHLLFRDPVRSLEKFPLQEYKNLENFTQSQTDKLLDVLNNSTRSSLEAIPGMTEPLLEKLIEHQNTHGNIESISTLMNINGYESKTVEAMCLHVIQKGGNDNYCKDYVIPKAKINPKFVSSEIPQSIVSCNLHVASLSWLHLSSDLTVHRWEHRPLLDPQKIRYDHVRWYEKISEVVEELPTPDETSLYLMEDLTYRTTSISESPAILARARLDSIFTTVISTQLKKAGFEGDEMYIYKLKPKVTAEHFALDLAGQRVSGRQAVMDMDRGHCPPGQGVTIGDTFMDAWRGQSRTKQDLMGNCLLTAVAFYKQLGLN